MSLVDRGQPAQVCPRCKTVLPPNEVTCYKCDFQLVRKQPASTTRPSPSSARVRERSRAEKYAPIFYFLCALFVVSFIGLAGLRAAGLSPTALLPQSPKPAVITYSPPKTAPLFSDSFVNDASGWNLQSSPGDYAVTVGSGTLTMKINKNKLLWEPLPGTISYSDFTLTVDAVLAQGDQNNGYGVYVRGTANQQSDLATYYRFELYGDGSYAIFKGVLDAGGHTLDTKLVNYTLNPVIQKQGKVNHLMITTRGASLSLIVNGQLVKTLSDPSYTSGSIALFASNLPEARPGIQVQFSQLAIYSGHLSKAE